MDRWAGEWMGIGVLMCVHVGVLVMCNPLACCMGVQYMKPYYAELTRQAAGGAPFAPVYLTPGSRYHYQSPAFLRHDVDRKKDLNTSPFLSMWVRATFSGHAERECVG